MTGIQDTLARVCISIAPNLHSSVHTQYVDYDIMNEANQGTEIHVL
jgi:hypothetical protein